MVMNIFFVYLRIKNPITFVRYLGVKRGVVKVRIADQCRSLSLICITKLSRNLSLYKQESCYFLCTTLSPALWLRMWYALKVK